MPDHPANIARNARAELDAILPSLGAEELLVLRYLATRLAAGQEAYGRLDLVNDRRDFAAERADELADAIVYSAMAEVRRVLLGQGRAREAQGETDRLRAQLVIHEQGYEDEVTRCNRLLEEVTQLRARLGALKEAS